MNQLVEVAPGNPAAQGEKPAGSEQQQYLTFALGGEMYAVEILNVREIIEYGNLTEIPMMPALIRGVINLRGAVVPVVDLRVRFGGRAANIGRHTCIVIAEVGSADQKREVGIIVDAVSEVLEIPYGKIEPPPAFGAKIRSDFIAGIGKVAEKFVIILAIDCILSMDDLGTMTNPDIKEALAA